MNEQEHLTDAELLDFDRSRLSDADRIDFEGQLETAGDRYRDHLMIAHWVAGWEQRLVDRAVNEPDTDRAFRSALREVAAHLRQGDFLPGRSLFTQYGSDGSATS